MLLEFSIQNFKSFRDKTVFSMEPKQTQKELEYSIHKQRLGRRVYKALSASVIYGPNAAGKTTIIGALETLKNIIVRGNIRDSEIQNSPNISAYELAYIPNEQTSNNKPVEFCIKFFAQNILFEYSLSMDIGEFLELDYPRKIVFESLQVNNRIIYERKYDNITIGDISEIKQSGQLSDVFIENETAAKAFIQETASDELLLANGFKQLISSDLYTIIANWFTKQLLVVFHGDKVRVTRRNSNAQENSILIEEELEEAAKLFGISSNGICFADIKGEGKARLYSYFEKTKEDENDSIRLIPADEYESYGTIRFVNLFPIITGILKKGGVLAIDEFDASIHPMALMNIISIFHNNEINTKGAQLIFNTHNPIFLNSAVFRKDEIKFIERDPQGYSSCYSLADFYNNNSKYSRKPEDYMKNYFINRYGAIQDIDFSPLFERIMKADDTDEIAK
ncbi:MAG: ATP-binding protein [Eggerthellaceae bacterium]|nr:ATP-binding protein [Eggerthellaceae bacterium]